MDPITASYLDRTPHYMNSHPIANHQPVASITKNVALRMPPSLYELAPKSGVYQAYTGKAVEHHHAQAGTLLSAPTGQIRYGATERCTPFGDMKTSTGACLIPDGYREVPKEPVSKSKNIRMKPKYSSHTLAMEAPLTNQTGRNRSGNNSQWPWTEALPQIHDHGVPVLSPDGIRYEYSSIDDMTPWGYLLESIAPPELTTTLACDSSQYLILPTVMAPTACALEVAPNNNYVPLRKWKGIEDTSIGLQNNRSRKTL